MLEKLNCYAARASIFLVAAVLIAGMVGCNGGGYNPPPSQNLEIRTWYDLDDVRDNLAGNHTLMNDLDSTTPGYEELASPTANGGKGWEPLFFYPPGGGGVAFTGTFSGQGNEIGDLFINRPNEYDVGLFGVVDNKGVIKDAGMVNATVIGYNTVGGLVGSNWGTLSNCHSTGSVTAISNVGGLVGRGQGSKSSVSDSHSSANVTGAYDVGGLVGEGGAVSNSYFTGDITGDENVGGLVGYTRDSNVNDSYATSTVSGTNRIGGLVGRIGNGNVINSYSTGSVAGENDVGGLVGLCEEGTVGNSYAAGNVTGTGPYSYRIGGLVGHIAGPVSNSYAAGNVTGTTMVGGLVGSVWGDVSNSYATGNVNGTGAQTFAGGVVGTISEGTVSNSYSTGNVTGNSYVGGLVGNNNYYSNVTNSCSTGRVTGNSSVGGLVGANWNDGSVRNSFWDTETSGQATSAGGMGKNTTEMQDITTFSGAAWNITAVANPGTRNPSYIWNIVNGVTYPFLSWQP